MRMESEVLLKKTGISGSPAILYVEQNAPSLGYTRLLLAYEAIPAKIQAGCWSFGDPYYPTDIWTCHGSLRSKLEKVDYVIIKFADEKFYDLLRKEKISFDDEITSGSFQVVKSTKGITLNRLT